MKLAVSREELFLSPFACCDELAKHRRASAVPVFNLCAQRIPQLFSPLSYLLPSPSYLISQRSAPYTTENQSSLLAHEKAALVTGKFREGD